MRGKGRSSSPLTPHPSPTSESYEFTSLILRRRGPGHRLHVPARGRRCEDPARRGPLPGAPLRGAKAQRRPAVRCPPHRHGGGEPRTHRPHRAPAAAGEERLPRPDLLHPRHARPVRGDAARCRAHPGEGRGVPAPARQGRTRERAALLPRRCRRGAGPHGGPAVPSSAAPAEDADRRVHRRGAHPRFGNGGPPLQRGHTPAHRLLRRHRPQRAADHPRPAAAIGPHRHAHRRGDLRRSRPRERGRRREAPGRGGANGGGARREDPHPGVCGGPGAGTRLCAAPAVAPRERCRKFRSMWTARSR